MPTQSQPPESHAQWSSDLQTNMLKARNLSRSVLDMLRENAAAAANAKQGKEAEEAAKKDRERLKVKARVKAHAVVINNAQRGMREIEDSLNRVEGCSIVLRKERYEKFALLQVCEMRLEKRSERPLSESFRDSVQMALERERTMLVGARQELLNEEALAKQMIHTLRESRGELSKDTGSRRLACHHETSSLKQLPGLSVASKPPVAHADTAAVIQRTRETLDGVEKLESRTSTLVTKVKRDAVEATRQVEKALAARTKEQSDVKRRFQESLRDVEHAIQMSERALHEEEVQLERNGGIDKTLQDKVAAIKSYLKQLAASKESLTEDLRAKDHALDIDASCRRVTPQMASEPKKLRSSSSTPLLNTNSEAVDP